ncbi:DUF4097 family beta strand repeat-containing protein [Microbacterium sp. SA39]|uniref:DUF4097 family beta strand repeat-containing protein n=1 Tax=Microbacterium sp. SA39 TaxID=1263625 RepID=UPI0005F9F42E|nr:DUF4097 family beta strand repeat-containing protein [Microbacterium sp. SA39]KJQ52557.1 hypothetical protein RS85_03450 [Microbacterium sp. SA39]
MTNEQNDLTGGHTPLTPQPASAPQGPTPPPSDLGSAPQAEAPRPEAASNGSGRTAITVGIAIFGGLALLGSGGTAAVAASGDLWSSSLPDSVQTVGVEGIDGLDLDVDGSNMQIEFGDVDEAELSITNGRGPSWTFERDGGELIVRSPESRWGWWFSNWFGDDELAVLTLPESLDDGGLEGDLTLDAGSLDVEGTFSHLGIDVSAGEVNVEGSATSLDVDMSAGRADILLDGVEDAVLGVSAGNLDVELTGTPPSQTTIDVSAGSVDLTVPDVSYAITQDVSAGSLDAKIEQSGSGQRAIDVTLSAGSVTIRPGN